ncbi:hypothetical protein DM77_3389 [Burkholderia mallei]|nr:hypothetical protein DM77_3389 [Burkholderia mallei]
MIKISGVLHLFLIRVGYKFKMSGGDNYGWTDRIADCDSAIVCLYPVNGPVGLE